MGRATFTHSSALNRVLQDEADRDTQPRGRGIWSGRGLLQRSLGNTPEGIGTPDPPSGGLCEPHSPALISLALAFSNGPVSKLPAPEDLSNLHQQPAFNTPARVALGLPAKLLHRPHSLGPGETGGRALTTPSFTAPRPRASPTWPTAYIPDSCFGDQGLIRVSGWSRGRAEGQGIRVALGGAVEDSADSLFPRELQLGLFHLTPAQRPKQTC